MQVTLQTGAFICILNIFVSLVCSVPPVGPTFGTVNTSVSEEGAVISWEYFGHHKNMFVEYIVENSKASLCICISNYQCMPQLL